MPEGDTIFRTARALHRALAGQAVTKFETALAPLARVDDDAAIAGRTIEKVEAKGKWCLIHLSGDLILLTHMLMSGSWHLYQPGERWRMRRAHMRVVIETASWQAIAFNVPVAEFHTARSLARHTSLPQLGPDILSDRYTPV
jgi:endonuclease-8